MIDPISSTTLQAIRVALDALAQRQQLIAANVANANNAGYTARDLTFESTLRDAMSNTTEPSQIVTALDALGTDVAQGALVHARANGTVELDAEMVRLNETVIRYQALVTGLGKFGSLTHIAISGEVK